MSFRLAELQESDNKAQQIREEDLNRYKEINKV